MLLPAKLLTVAVLTALFIGVASFLSFLGYGRHINSIADNLGKDKTVSINRHQLAATEIKYMRLLRTVWLTCFISSAVFAAISFATLLILTR